MVPVVICRKDGYVPLAITEQAVIAEIDKYVTD